MPGTPAGVPGTMCPVNAKAVLGSIAAVAAATGLVYALRPIAPTLSLGVVYILAVLASSVLFGTGYGIAVAIASMLAFNFFFLRPVHTLTLADGRNWTALAVYLIVAVVASQLATTARHRLAEAQQRERESAFLADVAAELLQTGSVDDLQGRADRALANADPVARERLQAAIDALLDIGRSDAIKTTILQAVSHDFRTPLATMTAALGGLSSGEVALSSEDRAELFEALGSELARLTRLVENLLDLSRLQAAAAVPHPELWDVAELVTLAVDEVGRGSVTVQVPDDLPAARVDATQVQRALVNLLENALKFSGSGVPVTVTARESERSVTIEIDDRGHGIRPDEAEALLEPFARGGAVGQGAGLGLAIAHGFALANGGALSLAPREGGGTRASLTLPAERVSAEALQ